jgi:signal transduction histidine kinase
VKLSASNGRTFFGKYRRTHSQVRLAFLFLGAILCSLGGMVAVLIAQLTQAISALEAAEKIDPIGAQTIRQALSGSAVFFVAIAMTVAALGFILGAQLANRIFGPMVAIKKMIEKLKDGNYTGRIHLRKNDEFNDVADELNLLAEKLEASQKS